MCEFLIRKIIFIFDRVHVYVSVVATVQQLVNSAKDNTKCVVILKNADNKTKRKKIFIRILLIPHRLEQC